MRKNEKGLGGMRRDENKDEDGMNDGMELRMKEEVSPGCIILLYSSPAGYTNRYTHTHTLSLTHTHTHSHTPTNTEIKRYKEVHIRILMKCQML